MKRLTSLVVLALSAFLSACQFFGPPTAEQTLVAENYVLNTEIAALRATATVEADRMLVTLEHAQTAMSHVTGQTQELSATLIARGTPSVDLSGLSPQVTVDIPTLEPALQIAPPANSAIVITPGSVSAETGALPGDTAQQPALVITPVSAENTVLSNIVTAPGVGDDDCAINPTSQFTSSSSEIYVVARARGVAANDEIVSRWYRDGEEVINYPWTPGFEIEDACIWFFIEESEVPFVPGNWQVQMELNGEVVGAPVTFTILDDTAAGDALLEQALGGGATTPTSLP